MFRLCFHGQHANYLPFVCGAEARLTEPQREPKESCLFLLSNYLSEGCIQFVLFNYLVESISGSWTKAWFSRGPRQSQEPILMWQPRLAKYQARKHLERTGLRQAAPFPTYTCNRVYTPDGAVLNISPNVRVTCLCLKCKRAAEFFTLKKKKKRLKVEHMDALQRVSSCQPALWSCNPASASLFPHCCSAAYVGHRDGVQCVWLSQILVRSRLRNPVPSLALQDPRVGLLECCCCQRPTDVFSILCCLG